MVTLEHLHELRLKDNKLSVFVDSIFYPPQPPLLTQNQDGNCRQTLAPVLNQTNNSSLNQLYMLREIFITEASSHFCSWCW